MAIGGNLKSFGKTKQSSGLQTGSKVTKRAEETEDLTGGIFSGLHEIRNNKELLKRDTQDADINKAWDTYKSNNGANKGDLLKQLEPTINAAITNMVGGDKKYLTKARLMALESLDSYDPNMGASLSTYVYNRLQGLRRIAADRGNFLHIPERSALERKQLEGIKQDYVLENGVEPSLAMLADLSGFPINKVERLMSIFGTTSTSATNGEHGDSLVAKKRTANELYLDTFYNDLSEIDKKIYEWSTGYRGSPRLDRATIAARLGISEAAISQRAHKIDRQAAKFNAALTESLYGRSSQEY